MSSLSSMQMTYRNSIIPFISLQLKPKTSILERVDKQAGQKATRLIAMLNRLSILKTYFPNQQ